MFTVKMLKQHRFVLVCFKLNLFHHLLTVSKGWTKDSDLHPVNVMQWAYLQAPCPAGASLFPIEKVTH